MPEKGRRRKPLSTSRACFLSPMQGVAAVLDVRKYEVIGAQVSPSLKQIESEKREDRGKHCPQQGVDRIRDSKKSAIGCLPSLTPAREAPAEAYMGVLLQNNFDNYRDTQHSLPQCRGVCAPINSRMVRARQSSWQRLFPPLFWNQPPSKNIRTP